ncbi:MAG TPA: GNAT family N-acetyltransferase, partial [Saprospiraceae bacterium]|nr:GNAT family N-acetyltransferase [Saprospiraceae bacterium]
SRLVELALEYAKNCQCSRVWLVTTNDNIRAIRFYQKRGFDLVALHRNALEAARLLKPEIPMTGQDGIPIRHELEFCITL